MGLITETDYQYYEGEQIFKGDGNPNQEVVCTFNTEVTDGDNSPPNYIVETSPFPITPTSWTLLALGTYAVSNNVVRLNSAVSVTSFIRVKLVQPAVWNNYGGYEYISLDDVVNNFLLAYVGDDKLVPRIKRSDVIFHAKRGLQEFSYDTLKSVNSLEISVPPSLSYPLPPDYVNYVQLSWIDNLGVKHIIYPTTLTSNPTEVPIQDGYHDALPLQDNYGENLESQQSLTNVRWRNANDKLITGQFDNTWTGVNDWYWWKMAYGQRYGMNPETSNKNGWFNIDERRGQIAFSSDLANRLVMVNYISDGLGYDMDMKIPKMAEEAIYLHILHAILSTRSGVNEYVVRRFKKERSAALRNAKIRLSNIKLEAFSQVMRGKSKWLKF